MKRPTRIEVGCGLGLAVIIATSLASVGSVGHAEPVTTQPSALEQCMAEQDVHPPAPARSDPLLPGLTFSCQVGSVQNQPAPTPEEP